ncbi:DUF1351 domain-containing protein [[Clostridium] aminophilum]|uniref:DUF1351 domain-containing protein n=1 Tax=[Clostridium] aminophilum TaxID=1526 RepID=A0A1I6KGI9_9FIRM|nr:DUF1351 domain-containing protein [[Clostridium] aminophilum]SET66741.1 Protein of unknown function [[Clostridium] aminophilum]SFR90365.1 Protein of unknown function [[Clostridium] aminophilum]
MNELQIVDLEQKDISTWDFAKIKSELELELEVYRTTVYTDETIKSAKADKATLSKAKKMVEDRRKEYKERCLAPYSVMEPQIKELVSMIEEQRTQIDAVVKDFTERQKQAKEEQIRAYYDKKAKDLGKYADALFEKILDPKWLNKTTTNAKYQEEMIAAIDQSVRDINEIQDMNSPFIDSLLEVYAATLSVDEAKKKHEELARAMSRVGLDHADQIPVQDRKEAEKAVVVDEKNGTTVKFFANKGKIDQILDFARAIGANYEICGD